MVVLADWTFGSVIWSMFIFFFWFMAIWVFIALFADILRREDLSGWAKAGWLILLFVIPFLGALIYIGVRPKMTAQDQRMMAKYEAQQRRGAGYSAPDEIAKAAKLRDDGVITAEEYERIKAQALM